MPRIGLRHLKTHASQVLRDVEDNRVRYVVTNRGDPVAVIVPYAPEEEVERQTREQAWSRLPACGNGWARYDHSRSRRKNCYENCGVRRSWPDP